MLEKEKIDRINFLAKKSKGEGLTEEERKEQHILREEFLIDFRARFKKQLDNIEFVEDIGEEHKDVEKNREKH
ncbi:DUF896 domain-containing protein [Sinanaerobacter sp. ZZT-01]|uniref:DUF896 domain-containing protein n=1 Tax=Sinanaerobacter sp. ZZT-01 TaxID=3111540 RepID=UPI002D79E9CD|nr:DUF896 domain-containing protein [Sinanaerobacter sp. ZZT-01]WRR93090.1 DUF896 domain-containing protein [Sinanaerobacter sp. ZZT-01]